MKLNNLQYYRVWNKFDLSILFLTFASFKTFKILKTERFLNFYEMRLKGSVREKLKGVYASIL